MGRSQIPPPSHRSPLVSDFCRLQNVVYLTINLPNIIESSVKYELTPSKISFKAKANVGK